MLEAETPNQVYTRTRRGLLNAALIYILPDHERWSRQRISTPDPPPKPLRNRYRRQSQIIESLRISRFQDSQFPTAILYAGSRRGETRLSCGPSQIRIGNNLLQPRPVPEASETLSKGSGALFSPSPSLVQLSTVDCSFRVIFFARSASNSSSREKKGKKKGKRDEKNKDGDTKEKQTY